MKAGMVLKEVSSRIHAVALSLINLAFSDGQRPYNLKIIDTWHNHGETLVFLEPSPLSVGFQPWLLSLFTSV